MHSEQQSPGKVGRIRRRRSSGARAPTLRLGEHGARGRRAELRVEVLFAVFWSTSSVGSCGKLALHWLEIHYSKRETSFTNSEYYLQKVEKQLEGNIFLYFSPQGQKGKNTAKLYKSCIKGSWYTSLQLLSTENSVILAY